AGLKLGPYIPDIDGEFALAEGQQGPYQRTFGGSAVMFLGELDRYFLWPAGQLGVTASGGWMGKTANAYETVACASPAEPGCVGGVKVALDDEGPPIVSAGDTTSFRLIPLFLGAVYRFTALDDRVSIPLVP